MKIIQTPNLWRVHLKSLPDVMRYLTTTPRVWDIKQGEAYKPSTDWDLDAGWPGTLELCRTGWSEGSQKMRLVLKQLGKVTTPQVLHKVNMEAGNFLMDRYLTGNPECFRAKVKSRKHGKPTVRFAVNISSNCDTTGQALANCGAAIAQAVKQLEAIGNKVEVTTYDASRMKENKRIVTGWNVKSADEKLNMAALAFSIAHPAAMRRVSFSIMERAPMDFYTGNYGGATELLHSDLEHSDSIIFNVCLTANSTCRTPEMAVATINAVLAKQR